MAVRRPEPVLAADKDVAEAKRWLAVHCLHCGQCASAMRADLPWNTCETGWALAKFIVRQRNQFRRVVADHEALAAAQETLF